jgi:hypothetical protein
VFNAFVGWALFSGNTKNTKKGKQNTMKNTLKILPKHLNESINELDSLISKLFENGFEEFQIFQDLNTLQNLLINANDLIEAIKVTKYE